MSKSLLVVDDSMIIREMIKDAAISDGWTIVGEGANGQEAVDLYHRLRPTALTLDLIMPHFDGLHALRNLQAADPSARILVVSALEQKSVLKQALELGASDFIVKPFATERLLNALAKLAAAAATSVAP